MKHLMFMAYTWLTLESFLTIPEKPLKKAHISLEIISHNFFFQLTVGLVGKMRIRPWRFSLNSILRERSTLSVSSVLYAGTLEFRYVFKTCFLMEEGKKLHFSLF